MEKVGIKEEPKICKQRNLNYGRECKGQLLRLVKLKSSDILYPIKVYFYSSLKELM